MTSAVKKLFIVFALLNIFNAGCADRFKQKGAHRYLIPSMNSDGSYSWKEVELTTLDSPTRLSGSTANIHYKPTAGSSLRWGPVVEPHMTKSGNVWIPLDTPSAIAISAYANMEAIRRWEESVHPKTQNVYPRTIVLEVSIRDDGELLKDNAMYLPIVDSVLVVPYSGSGIPLSVNLGIMTHEHFHVQFYHNVMREIFDNRNYDESRHNEKVLRSWNEGLADFYAYAFTQQPRFMDPSKLLMPGGMITRALDIAFESLSSEFMSKTDNNRLVIDEKTNTCIKGSVYCLGTQVGRMLYQMAQGSPQKTTDMIRSIYDSFPQWEKNVNAKFSRDTIQTNDFLKWTFDGKRSTLDPVQLDVLRKAGVSP